MQVFLFKYYFKLASAIHALGQQTFTPEVLSLSFPAVEGKIASKVSLNCEKYYGKKKKKIDCLVSHLNKNKNKAKDVMKGNTV